MVRRLVRPVALLVALTSTSGLHAQSAPSASAPPPAPAAPSTSAKPSTSAPPSAPAAPSASAPPSAPAAPSTSAKPSTSATPSAPAAPSTSATPSASTTPSASAAPSTTAPPSVSAAPSTTAPPSTSAARPAAPAAPPAPTPDQIARAKTLFDLGAKAYDSEQFPAAIHAFLEAYRLSQRPGPIFSAAQAYRRIFTNDRTNADALRQAVRYYKEYIEKQKAGGRIGEAKQALQDLEPLVAQLDAAPAGSAPLVAPAPAIDVKAKTRLMVSSPTKGAMASLDGGELAEMPLIQELTPGTHTLRLAAEGYVDDEREIIAVEGEVYGLDIALRERPAYLTLRTTEGAQVLVDGRPEGLAPLLKPIELTPGTHLVTLTKTGHEPYSAEIELRRDQKRPLDVTLERTSQRYASFVLLGAAGVGAIGGAVLTAFAFREEDVALKIEALKDAGNITEQQRATHDSAISNRNDLRAVAATSFGAAGLLALVGAGLYFFDRPTPGVPITLRDESASKAPDARRKPKVDASVTPFVGPTGGGALVEMRF